MNIISVNHSENYLDPDTDATTNTIESKSNDPKDYING